MISSESNIAWKDLEPIAAPIYVGVAEDSITDFCSRYKVAPSLVAFWRDSGAAHFGYDLCGDPLFDDCINSLLGPDDLAELIEKTSGVVEDVVQCGLPFINKFDLEFLYITTDGRIVSYHPDGSILTISSTLDTFVQRVIREPYFYDDIVDEYEGSKQVQGE